MTNRAEKLLEYTKAQNLTAPQKHYIELYREEIVKLSEGDDTEKAKLAANYTAMLKTFKFFAMIEDAAHAAAVLYTKQNEAAARLEGYLQALKDGEEC